MGQDLLNPPSVEGWHTGKEWIDTGILVERVNFAPSRLATSIKPGMKDHRPAARPGRVRPSVRGWCLDLIGRSSGLERTQRTLVDSRARAGL
jgi:hypothetical protein